MVRQVGRGTCWFRQVVAPASHPYERGGRVDGFSSRAWKRDVNGRSPRPHARGGVSLAAHWSHWGMPRVSIMSLIEDAMGNKTNCLPFLSLQRHILGGRERRGQWWRMRVEGKQANHQLIAYFGCVGTSGPSLPRRPSIVKNVGERR